MTIVQSTRRFGSSSEYETESSTDVEVTELTSKLPVSPGGTVGSKAVRSAHWPVCAFVFYPSLNGCRAADGRFLLVVTGSPVHLSSL